MSFEQDAVIVEPQSPHQSSVIWLHGLGADGHDFEPIVPELRLPEEAGIRFIFPNAPIQAVTINNGMQMRSWYDIRSPNLREREDAESITASAAMIKRYIQFERDAGISPEHIMLAGFSQGGAIALHTGLRYPDKLAGIIALSTYLPLPETLSEEASDANQNVSLFMAHGVSDPVIPLEQGRDSCDMLKQTGYMPEWNEYMIQHAVCSQEIEAISTFIQKMCYTRAT